MRLRLGKYYCTRRELWNLDTTLAKVIHDVLVQFKGTGIHGYPDSAGDEEHWNEILDKMIWSFEALTRCGLDNFEADQVKIQEGLDLFAKHFRDLWD